MQRNQQVISAGGIVILVMVMLNAIVMERGMVKGLWWYKLLYVTVPLLLLSVLACRKKLF